MRRRLHRVAMVGGLFLAQAACGNGQQPSSSQAIAAVTNEGGATAATPDGAAMDAAIVVLGVDGAIDGPPGGPCEAGRCGGATVLADGQHRPGPIAVDGSNLYWANQGTMAGPGGKAGQMVRQRRDRGVSTCGVQRRSGDAGRRIHGNHAGHGSVRARREREQSVLDHGELGGRRHPHLSRRRLRRRGVSADVGSWWRYRGERQSIVLDELLGRHCRDLRNERVRSKPHDGGVRSAGTERHRGRRPERLLGGEQRPMGVCSGRMSERAIGAVDVAERGGCCDYRRLETS